MHKMLCGSYAESNSKKLELKGVDGAAFGQTLDIWCGKESSAEIRLGDVRELVRVADQFQMTEVVSALERTVMGI